MLYLISKIDFVGQFLYFKGFDYIIGRRPPQKICFGSTMEREILPPPGPHQSSLMRRILCKPLLIDDMERASVCKHHKLQQAKNKSRKRHRKVDAKRMCALNISANHL